MNWRYDRTRGSVINQDDEVVCVVYGDHETGELLASAPDLRLAYATLVAAMHEATMILAKKDQP